MISTVESISRSLIKLPFRKLSLFLSRGGNLDVWKHYFSASREGTKGKMQLIELKETSEFIIETVK
jgi:hypothetical protein